MDVINFEYPVNLRVKPSDELVSWGDFREDKISIEKIAQLSIDAQKIIDSNFSNFVGKEIDILDKS